MKNVLKLLLVIFIVAFSACSEKKTETATIQTVKIDTVRIYGQRQQVTFPGKIKAASDVNLAFRVAGPIAKINVEAGNFVRKGDVLAEIDSRDYAVQLSATEAEYKKIKAEADRVIELYGKGSVAPNDYDKAVYGLTQITAKYDAHKNALADTKLRAPFDGYIQKRIFNADETVGAGMPVISMINAGVPEVEINIPSSEFINRKKFETFTCTVDIYPNKAFTLDLIGIAQKANMNQLYTMRLKLTGKDANVLTPGMAAMVNIEYRHEQSDLVTVPFSSIFESDGNSSVWIYNAETETVTARTITPSNILIDGTVIVTTGLKAGEIVISAGVHVLQQGEKVKPIQPSASTNIGGLL